LEDFPDFTGCIQGSPQSANIWLKQPKALSHSRTTAGVPKIKLVLQVFCA